ncbi:MAG: transglycosylase, partial [Limnohabitans sp.]
MRQILWRMTLALIVGSLVACGTARRAPVEVEVRPAPAPVTKPLAEAPRASGVLAGTPGAPNPQQSYRSRWVAVSWRDVPGWQNDKLQEAW